MLNYNMMIIFSMLDFESLKKISYAILGGTGEQLLLTHILRVHHILRVTYPSKLKRLTFF